MNTSFLISVLLSFARRKYHSAQFPLCSWIYDRNEVDYYIARIIGGLKGYYVEEHLPTDPVSLSYWFVQNFQLTHGERLEIMKLNSAWERLRLELEYLKMVQNYLSIIFAFLLQ